MSGKYVNPRRRPRRRRNLKPVVAYLSIALVLLLGVALWASTWEPGPSQMESNPSGSSTLPSSSQNSAGSSSTQSTQSTPPTKPPVVKVSTATLINTGDMLMHMPVINSAQKDAAGNYDFTASFQYIQDYLTKADLAVANLETTLAGPDRVYYDSDGNKHIGYSGYPAFNCPDGIVTSLKDVGFNMLLTANNHTYDTRSNGFHRTQQVLTEAGMDYLGTVTSTEDTLWQVKDLNGIQVGMMCYTYQTDDGTGPQNYLNGIPMTKEDSLLIGTFSYSQLEQFYTEMAGYIEDMENAGAEAVVLYIHWGNEYETTENRTQNAIAQKLCDLGVDVIVGGHSHVVQPMELLTSTQDPDHKTVCLYSMGNAISNQRLETLGRIHTEDGVLFSFTFAKYSDGTVILESADLIPVWVNHYYNSAVGRYAYEMLPLDKQIEDWKTQFNLTDAGYQDTVKSYDRTMAIVGEGLEDIRTYLATLVEETELRLDVKK